MWYIPLLWGRRFADFGLPDLHVPGLRQWFCTLCVVPARFLVTAVLRLRRKWALRLMWPAKSVRLRRSVQAMQAVRSVRTTVEEAGNRMVN